MSCQSDEPEAVAQQLRELREIPGFVDPSPQKRIPLEIDRMSGNRSTFQCVLDQPGFADLPRPFDKEYIFVRLGGGYEGGIVQSSIRSAYNIAIIQSLEVWRIADSAAHFKPGGLHSGRPRRNMVGRSRGTVRFGSRIPPAMKGSLRWKAAAWQDEACGP